MARSVLDRISSINKPVNRVESGVSPGNSSVSGDRFVANSISFDKLITLLYYTSNSLAIVCQTSTKRESRSLAIGREEASPSGINRREMNSRGGRRFGIGKFSAWIRGKDVARKYGLWVQHVK